MNWVRSLSELEPDLVVLTGDLLGHTQAIPSLGLTLEPLLRDRASVFVHGSNDYYGPMLKNPLKYLREPSRLRSKPMNLDTARLTAMLEQAGSLNLNNRAAQVTIRGTDLSLFGLNDPHIRLDDAAAMHSSLETVNSSLEKRTTTPTRIGVVHAPYRESLDTLLRAGADCIFAGHTHGGQVRVPGVGALTSNCDLPTRQARGLSVWFDEERASYLNVSAGLGNSIYAPVRFACRPEASLITLTSPQ